MDVYEHDFSYLMLDLLLSSTSCLISQTHTSNVAHKSETGLQKKKNVVNLAHQKNLCHAKKNLCVCRRVLPLPENGLQEA
jgi:hypothetical protein